MGTLVEVSLAVDSLAEGSPVEVSNSSLVDSKRLSYGCRPDAIVLVHISLDHSFFMYLSLHFNMYVAERVAVVLNTLACLNSQLLSDDIDIFVYLETKCMETNCSVDLIIEDKLA